MKTYIKPEIEIYNVEVEQLLLAGSEEGQIPEPEDVGDEDDEFIFYGDDNWK